MDYETRPLTQEEGDALSKEMLKLLEKHGAELGVVSSIQILKRVYKETSDSTSTGSIVSPFLQANDTTGTPNREDKENPEAEA